MLTSCKRTEPPLQIIPDMDNQKRVNSLSERPRAPVKDTVARNEVFYTYTAEEAELKLKNPLQSSRDILNRGQFVYNVFCLPCHASNGTGFGPVVQKGFVPPPSLLSMRVQSWKDGRIFHVITTGQNTMPAYDLQIEPFDRWAVILYIRALQKLPKEEKQ